ncbi:MAG: 7-carboxy-7-deazaguanine synthase [Rhodomicrobium sp.]
MYAVKEIYMTLQGEGARAGRAAVFLRFAGCNLWSGLERDRDSAICKFCDTDFVGVDGLGGGKFANADALATAVAKAWTGITGSPPSSCSSPQGEKERRCTLSPRGEGGLSSAKPYVVCTGGEPLLQVDAPLTEALHAQGFEVAVETNGTMEPPEGLDWICVSPKANAPLVLTQGHELKLVFPQNGAEPERFAGLDFKHFFLQPMDGPDQRANIALAARYCLRHPRWRLSLQTHKFIGLP